VPSRTNPPDARPPSPPPASSAVRHIRTLGGALPGAVALALGLTVAVALTEGVDTVPGDRGERLSGGERQRLALARAVLRRPALLVLDEATSQLDSENERRIQDAIDRLHHHVTILVITHRLPTVRLADVIHVVEDGRVVESGDWDSLVTRDKGRFRALCVAQGLDV
jgi:ATP-binding cassette subfamily C protein